MTHRFINADGLVSTGTGILGHNMFAYCDNNPLNYSDSGGSYPTYPGRLVGGGTFSNVPTHQLGYLGQIEEYWQDGEVVFVAADYRVGTVNFVSHGNFTYTKSGAYTVNDYSPSIVSVYALNNFNDFWQSEAGVEICNGLSLCLGFDNLGLQLGLPIDDTMHSIEASLSFYDGCIRLGWDATTRKDNRFIVGGEGIEFNIADALSIVTIFVGSYYGANFNAQTPQNYAPVM